MKLSQEERERNITILLANMVIVDINKNTDVIHPEQIEDATKNINS